MMVYPEIPVEVEVYAKMIEYACYAVSGSEYGETAPLITVWGAILGVPW